MGKISSYKDLLVWQKSVDLVELVYQVAKKLPDVEQFGLVSQVCRAAVSIPSNIAEGYGRQSTGHYRQHLSIALGSLLELETQFIICRRLPYLSDDDIRSISDLIQQLNK